jgi:mRNA interferase YafQ
MYGIMITNKFKNDVKLLYKRGYDTELLKKLILQFENKGRLPKIFRSHKLFGEQIGYWEAHIKPDWLIIWKVFE